MSADARVRTAPVPIKNGNKSVRRILLAGVFWRILAIEGILLVATLAYESVNTDADILHILFYAMRIIGLIVIIVLFMMLTLKSFLNNRIIEPLEKIASANRRLLANDASASHVNLPDDTPGEIMELSASRSEMLETILKVSDERLRLVRFIQETFGRYLSKSVVDEILKSPEGPKVGGKRKTVTILMSDLRGFTQLSETSDPEEMVRLLNLYFEKMSKVILKYDGMIDEFIGDAILVVFGVPEEREDDAARAVACGIAMQNALVELNEAMIKDSHDPLEMGIGINTGVVIVGNVGSEMRLKYGIVGSAINIAGRIEANTTGGDVHIGETTYNLVKDVVNVDTPFTAMMKGVKKPLAIFPTIAIGHPYNVKLEDRSSKEKFTIISLPFHFWKLDNKRIVSDASWGETICLNENTILVRIEKHLEPFTDIKLVFDFCVDAHSFEDVYLKVISAEEHEGRPANLLKITSINQKDRDILNKWMRDIS